MTIRFLCLALVALLPFSGLAEPILVIKGLMYRPVDHRKRIKEMRAAAKKRLDYHENLKKRIDAINAEREQLVHITSAATRQKILSEELTSKCAKEMQTGEQIDNCIEDLSAFIDDNVDIRVRVLSFVRHEDEQMRNGAQQVLRETAELSQSLHKTYAEWTANRFTLIRESMRKGQLEADQAGRLKALCVSGPVKLLSQINSIEVALFNYEKRKNPSEIVRALRTLRSANTDVEHYNSICETKIKETEVEKLRSLGRRADAELGSNQFYQFFREACERYDLAHPREVDCDKFTLELLFTVTQEKKQ